MGIFLRNLVITLPSFLTSLINLLQRIVASNPVNHDNLSIIIHDMYNANKKVLTALNYSKKTIPHKIFFEILNTSSG